MRELLSKIAPSPAIKYFRIWRERYLVDEISKLNIERMGFDGKIPSVKLADGPVFYGFLPNQYQRELYGSVSKKVTHIPEEHFAIVVEIISRYLVPRSIPGEMEFNSSRYKPLRDPLNDFHLDEENKRRIAKLFRPEKGDVFVDVGSYTGYGTMKVSELVGSEGRVIAFEADTEVLKILYRNIEENDFKNVTIVPKAAGAVSGNELLYKGGSTANSLNHGVLNILGHKNLDEIEVGVETIDHVLADLNIDQVDITSITVNGGEFNALSGMRNTLIRSGQIRLTLAGWYYTEDNKKICDMVEPQLKELGFHVMIGRLGRVLAWK